MRRYLALLLAVCLLLTGCGWLDGSYHSVMPHQQHGGVEEEQLVSVENYLQLRSALESMVDAGREEGTIELMGFRADQMQTSLELAARYVQNSYPIGAYAVEDITWELGTLGDRTAAAVRITYLHDRSEILRIRQAADMEAARQLIGDALDSFDPSLVMLVDSYQLADLHQLVEEYAWANPQRVMEHPEVNVIIYPDSGKARVVELKFSYQSSRDSLRSMQEVVQRVFDSAGLYVSADAADARKLTQLYSFLMERFDTYQVKTSITPAYSLLQHGVGDSEAVALVYAAMCSRAGVECRVVVGSRNGEPWYWNLVLEDGYYFHVDLLDCQIRGGYRALTDGQMTSYVWDYSAYPAATGRPLETVTEDPTQPPQDSTEGTLPADTVPPKTDSEKN